MTGVSGSSASSAAVPPRVATGPDALGAGTLCLAPVELRSLDDHEVLDRFAAIEAQVAAWTAEQLDAVAELARRPARIEFADDDPVAARAADAPLGRCVRDSLPDELAARLSTSVLAASGRVRVACGLAGLPATRAALAAGAIDCARARVMVDETAALDRDTAFAIDAAMVEHAARLAPARLRTRVRRAVLAADPVAAQRRAQRARDDRRVVITPVGHGMAELWALLPAVAATAIGAAITAAARASKAQRDPGDDRSMDARRADALAAPFLDALASGQLAGLRLATAHGRVAEVQVTVAATTLLGHDDAPAELHSYGPIDAATARDLAADARWRRILTDPRSGAVLDVGTTRYAPTAAITRHVVAREDSRLPCSSRFPVPGRWRVPPTVPSPR